ncbi:DUF6455 family protein [Ruegeria faecimaris]|uniref:DUF6455 domain-containing protein n=1 Tax=Ruegeria faecimaris TaxID=686389 RepID=A0A521CZT5_9RHOB|nr:DUF6455 family protein [Ruegeria faecimaris]SMO64956.1 hypothetical protein SAMN06265380_10484 [Ruegeria faecimaris]
MKHAVLGDVEKHFWLTRSVARCLKISLTEAMSDGRLSPDEYAEMVTRCRASDCHEKCTKWLAAQQSDPRSAPGFCVNSQVFNRLK